MLLNHHANHERNVAIPSTALRPSNEPKDPIDPDSTISFLPHERESEEGSPLKERYSSSTQKSFCRRHSTTLIIHLPLLLGNVVFTIFILLWSNSHVNGDYTLVHSVASPESTRGRMVPTNHRNC